MCPLEEVVAKPFAVQHIDSKLKQLVDYLKGLDSEMRMIMENIG